MATPSSLTWVSSQLQNHPGSTDPKLGTTGTLPIPSVWMSPGIDAVQEGRRACWFLKMNNKAKTTLSGLFIINNHARVRRLMLTMALKMAVIFARL